jgi:AAA domain
VVAVSTKTRVRLLSPDELDALPDVTWLISGVLPANSFCVLYGEPGCGKTFVALAMALSIGSGTTWCGKTAAHGSVLCVAAEGLTGLKLRARAYNKKHGLGPASIRYTGSAINLLDQSDISALSDALATSDFRPDLIVLDTLARVMPGSDENSAKEMGQAVRAIDELRRDFSASALVIHHTTKNSNRERGSSALRGAADLMIECSRSTDLRLITLKCDKMKDAEPFPTATVGLEKITLGPSSSSLAVTNWTDAMEAAGDSGQAAKALDVLRTKFGTEGATNKEWQEAFIAETKKTRSAGETAFDRALRKLKESNAVRQEGKKYFPANTAEAAAGVSVSEVSPKCHDTSAGGVMSAPFLGADT